MSEGQRLASLDVFRGFAIAAMILVNNPGSWSHIYGPLAHAAWHGCTFTDLVFPFFLFAAGMSMTLSLGRRAQQPEGRFAALRGLVRRAAVIFALGLGLNLLSSFSLASLRIPGVLQRIALTLVLAAPLVLWTSPRRRIAVATAAVGALFAVYLLLMLKVPVMGADGVVAAGRLEPGMDFGAWLDRLLLGGHLWARAKVWDPEGLVGTLPATANLLFGVMAGHYLQSPVPHRRAPRLAAAGVVGLALGAWAAASGLPLNKSLWTPSFALFTTGWACLFLAAFYALLDDASPRIQATARKAFLPLTIFGLNPLFLFVLSGVLGRLLVAVRIGGTPLKTGICQALAVLPLTPRASSLLFAVLFDLGMFAIAWFMWRRRWIVKV